MGATTRAETSTTSPFPIPTWAASSDDDDDILSGRPLPSPAPITCQSWCKANDGLSLVKTFGPTVVVNVGPTSRSPYGMNSR